LGCVLGSLGQSLARVKFQGATPPVGRDIVCQKVHFSGSKLTCNSKPLVDQSSPDFLKAGGNAIVCKVSRFWISCRSGDIRDQSSKWSKIDRNFACFYIYIFLYACFCPLPPIFFFWGGAPPPPEFMEWCYKIQLDSDYVAKFQGDRSRDLGDLVAKKRRHHG